MTTQVKESVSAWDSSNHATNPSASSDALVRLLFVDDDEDYREAVGAELVDHGFSVQSFPDGASMMDSLSAGLNADVIVLDWSLPATPGIDLLPQLRRRGVVLPVVRPPPNNRLRTTCDISRLLRLAWKRAIPGEKFDGRRRNIH